ncbi:type IV pilus biogenesis protein PilN [mine drainage metagenome]|uniref:Type IV pilus biogenesis protein PilN n=1 Tax=mine drainage metagenome TaxID=410659 RepID=T1C283_9ZZZZ
MGRHVVYETMDNTSALDAVQFIESNCGISVHSDDLKRSVILPPMSYQGSCSGLMAAVTQGIGYTSQYTTYGVRLMRAVTRTFQLPVIGGKIRSDAQVGAKNSTGGTGGGGGGSTGATSIGTSTSESSVTTTQSYVADEWRGLLLEAEVVASPAQLTADEATATVTVTGTHADVKRFSRWVRSLSHRLQRQVEISVQVYQVTLKNDENYGIAPGLVWKYLTGLNSVSVAAPSALTLSNGVNPGEIQFTSNTGPFNGTQASVSALSQIGSVHQVYNNTLLALDGYPVTVNDTVNHGYLAEVSTNAALTGASTFGSTTLTPGNISAGVAMSITPRIADGNRIVLSMVFRDTGNPTFKTITSGTEMLQVPQESVTSFNQMVDMPSGSTVMLLGFRNVQDESQTQGTGSPDFWLLGGGHLRQDSNTITVVTISAKAS